VHRIQPAQQGLAQRQACNDFVVQFTQLLFAAHRLQPLLVALAVARRRLQRTVDQQFGNMQARSAAVDRLYYKLNHFYDHVLNTENELREIEYKNKEEN